MLAPKRISIKMFIDNPELVMVNQIVPIFQRWIQRNQVEGLLIDVADYQHVHKGPGIILIGHEGDYAYNFGDDRPGIQYTLKLTSGLRFAEAIASTLGRLLQAARQLEREKSLANIQVNSTELLITVHDRLNFPNRSDTWLELIPDIQTVLADSYTSDLTIKAIEGDARDPLRIHVSSFAKISITELLSSFAVR